MFWNLTLRRQQVFVREWIMYRYEKQLNSIDLKKIEIVGAEVQVKSTVDLFGKKRSFIGKCFQS